MKKHWPLWVFLFCVFLFLSVPVIWFVEMVIYKGWAWTLGTLFIYVVAVLGAAALIDKKDHR
jgi:hypothetical protein